MKIPFPRAAFRSALPRAIVVFAVLPLCSCVTPVADPGLEAGITSVAFTEATVLETTARISVRIQNENPNAVTIDGAVHKIHLNGAYVGKGMSNESLTVERLATGMQTVNVYLRNLKLAGELRAVMRAKEADYRIESVLHTREFGRVRIENSGTVGLHSAGAGSPAGLLQ